MDLYDTLSTFGPVLLNEPMSQHTSYRIGGQADYYSLPDSLDHALDLLAFLQEQNIPYLILGKGSNVLFADQPYHGVIVNLERACNHYQFDDQHILHAGAGCSLIHLAVQAQKRSLRGLEFASGIPGSVGGGLYMNAGAYLSDLSEILIDVLVWRDGVCEWMAKEDLDYTYRHSLFQQHKDWIILEARFQLQPGSQADIQALTARRKERRMSSQPLDKPCAGSVFRNPQGMNAWQIIDDLGFRGLRCGGAQVSEKHTNFIVNESGQASAEDVNTLICFIQEAARDRFGVDLIMEVERINWNG